MKLWLSSGEEGFSEGYKNDQKCKDRTHTLGIKSLCAMKEMVEIWLQYFSASPISWDVRPLDPEKILFPQVGTRATPGHVRVLYCPLLGPHSC